MADVDSSATPVSTDPNLNSQEQASEVRTRRKTDIAWNYCTEVTINNKKKIKCMYCGQVFLGGGIHRFKEHLAKWPGNVTACKKVDPEVEHTMYQNIEDYGEKKRKAEEEGHPYGSEPIDVDAEEEECEISHTAARRVASRKETGRGRGTSATPSIGKYFKARTGPGDQPTIKSVLQGEAVREKVDLCVAKWFMTQSVWKKLERVMKNGF